MAGNYFFPNENPHEPLWGLIIVLYPFMTCMVDGCAFLACLGVLFRRENLRQVGRLALLLSVSFIPFAFVPLLLDIGRPERCFNIMTTPSLSSPMAIFGFIFSLVATVILLEAWFTFRPDFVARWQEGPKGLRFLYAILSLVVKEVTPRAEKIDRGIVKFLEGLSLPGAIILTGYVGFIFASVPGNPWWSSSLRPVIFLAAAFLGGVSAVTVMAVLVRPRALRDETVKALGCLEIIALLLMGALCTLEVAALLYPGGYSGQAVGRLFRPGGPLWLSFFGVQLLLAGLLPLFLLLLALLFRFRGFLLKATAFLAGGLGLVHTFSFLWNVVIGGQAVSRSLRGVAYYVPHLGGRKGIVATGIVLLLPLVTFLVLNFLVPAFPKEEREVSVSAS